MPDDLSNRHGSDRRRIDVGQDHERRHWSEKFGVTKEQLEEAVRAVGDDADRVEQHLRRRSSEKAASRDGAAGARADHAGGGNSLGDGRGGAKGGGDDDPRTR